MEFPPSNEEDIGALRHALQSSGFAHVRIMEWDDVDAIEDSIGTLHGAFKHIGRYWHWRSPFSARSDIKAVDGTTVNLNASAGSYKVHSTVKEYSHFTDGDLPEGARAGCELLKRLAMCAVDATDVASHLSTGARSSRSRSGSRILAPPKLQAYRYLTQPRGGVSACPEHVDGGLLTVVVHRGSRGLQTYDQLACEWVDELAVGRNEDEEEENEEEENDDEEEEEDTFHNGTPALFATILVGHSLEVASGGAYRAALHRVGSPTAGTDRLSLVLKLHLKDATWLPEANATAGDVLATFKRDHPTVNPLPADGRASAIGPVSFGHRRVDKDACPMHLCLFKMVYRGPTFPYLGDKHNATLPVCGVLRHSTQFPILSNPFYALWVLQEWSRDVGVELNVDIRQRITQLGTWAPTTAAEVIRALAAHVQSEAESPLPGPILGAEGETPVTEEHVRLAVNGRFIGLSSIDADEPLTSLFPSGHEDALHEDALHEDAPFNWSLVCGLGYALFPSAMTTDGGALINLKIVSQDGTDIFFRTRMRSPLILLFYAYASRQGVHMNSVRFLFDGHTVHSSETPAGLDMEDGDVIDVMVDQMGD